MNRPGRPAGPAADTAEIVLTAALELILTEGAAALTPQRLHAITGVARTTIYRHWPMPRDFLAALIEVAPHPAAAPTGDPVTDLHAEVDMLCDRLRDKPVAAFLRALITASVTDPACADLRRRYVEDLLAPFHRGVRALGVEDELRAAETAKSIVAPLLVDTLLLDLPVDPARAHRAVADALAHATIPPS
ncbi:TetR/AcrR family transcriptional regulator [Nocardia sp. alder85J]|uniref:TetR/AcrR family transcriptional regulator n=1 Tax=Nocardia sp. alder85J TaxID=2862949 RepID=UPI001CD2410E|nr:TetR/AcrR family transcriptional regulator C-terminal ligand-binding domain-containing protein [Nocardia sp. alder85J]MCX4096854.1 TetR/AcrR family transcriptional regulator C-terminal ligand-binding domain-containing protein [Nocardia sp. alder85J]